MMNARLTFVHALSPLHAGTGQGVGVIDLPIAREKATGLPFLPGSSLKGTLRARCSAQECKQVFGPDTTEVQTDSNHASSAQFSDHCRSQHMGPVDRPTSVPARYGLATDLDRAHVYRSR